MGEAGLGVVEDRPLVQVGGVHDVTSGAQQRGVLEHGGPQPEGRVQQDDLHQRSARAATLSRTSRKAPCTSTAQPSPAKRVRRTSTAPVAR